MSSARRAFAATGHALNLQSHRFLNISKGVGLGGRGAITNRSNNLSLRSSLPLLVPPPPDVSVAALLPAQRVPGLFPLDQAAGV